MTTLKLLRPKWNLVLFTSYSNLPKFPVWSLHYLTVHQLSMCCPSSTFGVKGQFRFLLHVHTLLSHIHFTLKYIIQLNRIHGKGLELKVCLNQV